MTLPLPRTPVDCTLVGNSPALLLTATLLARRGRRVMHFGDTATDLPWLFGGPVWDRLCRGLDLQLPVRPRPLQVITPRTRLEWHGDQPLSDELHRELPDDMSLILDWVNQLREQGEWLQRRLARRPSPLLGWRPRLAFSLGLRLTPAARHLLKPVEHCLPEALSPEARQVLRTLLEGLALAPLAQLSTAEAALLLDTLEAGEVDGEALGSALRQRLQQFHGRTAPLDAMQAIERVGSLWRITVKEGAPIGSTWLVTDNPAFLPDLTPHPTPRPRVWRLQPGQDRPQPMQERVVLAGTPTLRLLSSKDTPWDLRAVAPHGTADLDFSRRLGELLPFGALHVEAVSELCSSSPLRRGLVPANGLPLHPSPGLLQLDGTCQLPRLAGLGELLAIEGILRFLDGKS